MAMTVACTLHIRSDTHAALPSGFWRSRKKVAVEFTDNQSPEILARRERVRRKLGLNEVEIPRYHWRLSSDEQVTGDDLHEHLEWLLDHIPKDRVINDLLGPGFEYWFSAAWTGNGTGGGPLVSLQTSKLLQVHQAEMGIAFYLEAEA
jgi:hypothetical protein